MTYQELEKMAADDPGIVLLDLRSQSKSLTDLSKPFPGLNSIRVQKKAADMPASLSMMNKRSDMAHAPLYVLVDDGNGESEKAARQLMAAGKARVAILTGGELSLKRKGISGRLIKKTMAKVKNNQ